VRALKYVTISVNAQHFYENSRSVLSQHKTAAATRTQPPTTNPVESEYNEGIIVQLRPLDIHMPIEHGHGKSKMHKAQIRSPTEKHNETERRVKIVLHTNAMLMATGIRLASCIALAVTRQILNR